MYSIKSFFTYFLVFSASCAALAQQDDPQKVYPLSDVVITATRTYTPAIELASSVTVIDSATISNRMKTNVYELLQSEYGLSFTQQGGPGKLTNVYTRGANTSHTMILIDGVKMNMVNDPANFFDFSTLPVDNIERIEILRGPQSTLYGSDAMAGVINIITKKGAGSNNFFLSTEGGTYNTYKGMAGLNGTYDFLNYSVTMSRWRTDGFSSASEKYGNTEKDGAASSYFTARIGAKVSQLLDVNFFGRFNKMNADYDQFGGEFGDDPTFIFNLEEQAYRGEAILTLFDGLWNQKAGVSFTRNLRKYKFDESVNNPASSRSLYDGKRIKFDWQNIINLNEDNIFVAGVETEEEKAIGEYLYFSSFGDFESLFPQNKSRTTGAYFQHQFRSDNSFFNSTGVRYDNHNRFGSVLTYRIAPAYVFWQTGTKIKATFGTGFKAPSLFYLFDPGFGNSDLNPEKSYGWDAGIEQFFINNNFSAGINYFRTSFKDLFGFDENFRTININKAESKGIEVFITVKPLETLTVNSNYTFTQTKDLSKGSVDEGEELLRRPKHKASFNVNYNFVPNANAYVEISYTGQRDDKNFSVFPAERIKLSDYTLINLAVSYDVFTFLRIYGKVENLTNKYYEEVFGYATPGLSGTLGLKLTL